MNYCAPKTNASIQDWGPCQPLGERTVQKAVIAVSMPGHYRNWGGNFFLCNGQEDFIPLFKYIISHSVMYHTVFLSPLCKLVPNHGF